MHLVTVPQYYAFLLQFMYWRWGSRVPNPLTSISPVIFYVAPFYLLLCRSHSVSPQFPIIIIFLPHEASALLVKPHLCLECSVLLCTSNTPSSFRARLQSCLIQKPPWKNWALFKTLWFIMTLLLLFSWAWQDGVFVFLFLEECTVCLRPGSIHSTLFSCWWL